MARIASSAVIRSSSAKSSCFGSSSSTIASITRSQSARSATSVVSDSRSTAASRSACSELPLLDLARQEVRDPVARALGELHRDLAPDRLEAGLDGELRDPGTHRAEPDDADLPDLPRHGRAMLLGLPREQPLEPRLAVPRLGSRDIVRRARRSIASTPRHGSRLPEAARRSHDLPLERGELRGRRRVHEAVRRRTDWSSEASSS